jgi:hypothetical protein
VYRANGTSKLTVSGLRPADSQLRSTKVHCDAILYGGVTA